MGQTIIHTHTHPQHHAAVSRPGTLGKPLHHGWGAAHPRRCPASDVNACMPSNRIRRRAAVDAAQVLRRVTCGLDRGNEPGGAAWWWDGGQEAARSRPACAAKEAWVPPEQRGSCSPPRGARAWHHRGHAPAQRLYPSRFRFLASCSASTRSASSIALSFGVPRA